MNTLTTYIHIVYLYAFEATKSIVCRSLMWWCWFVAEHNCSLYIIYFCLAKNCSREMKAQYVSSIISWLWKVLWKVHVVLLRSESFPWNATWGRNEHLAPWKTRAICFGLDKIPSREPLGAAYTREMRVVAPLLKHRSVNQCPPIICLSKLSARKFKLQNLLKARRRQTKK